MAGAILQAPSEQLRHPRDHLVSEAPGSIRLCQDPAFCKQTLEALLSPEYLLLLPVLQVSEVPGIIERLLGFLEVGKDFVTAETVIQIKDLMRRYPDAAEVCVGSVANISPAVRRWSYCLGRHYPG